MQSDADGISKQFLAQKRERAEANALRFRVLETAVVNQAIELARIMPFRLKP